MERWVFGRRVRSGLVALSLSVAAAALGCATGGENSPDDDDGNGGGTITGDGGGGTGGAGGSMGPCDQDCSSIVTPPCFKAVCNEGQFEGPQGVCTVVPDDGTACDDGEFCTTQDTCQSGQCQGGPPNDCGMEAGDQCHQVSCDEAADMCTLVTANDGSPCVSEDLCQVGGACNAGECIGNPKDCFFSPHNECNVVACNPTNGLCEPTAPDPAKNGQPCQQSGDVCQVNKTCNQGLCEGGVAKDCSAVSSGCTLGVCNPANGNCMAEPIPPGGTCAEATDECNVGICDASGVCQPMPIADGTACNDFNSCTGDDTCAAGACAGSPVADCAVYFEDNFENGCPPGGWTLGGDWECGTPTGSGPGAAYDGSYCIGTQIDASYSNNQTYDVAIAQTPTISLASATEPIVQFAAWVQTEGCCDGANLKISTDGGVTFSVLSSVTPAYNLTIGSQAAWGGTAFNGGWQLFTADLAAYAGQNIILRFSFHSDSSVTYPGVYVDDISVGEANAIPLLINTPSPLPSAAVNNPYTVQLQKTGGTSASVWSIVSGTNHGWLTVDPTTGLLTGTPVAANVGPFSVTVRVEEPSLPSNFYEKVLDGEVVQGIYAESFEGACPNGWTLGGDWECGTPTAVGPATAYSGVQCLGTQIDGNYNNSQAWNVATATSPAIDLTGTTNPLLTFRMWVDTEGSVYDGANLKVSTDNMTFTQVMSVTPAYNITIGGEQAWGGRQSASGWQLFTADLTAYAGQMVYLRYAFRTDTSVVYPGVYIDDIFIAD